MTKVDALMGKMVAYMAGDPKRIQHFTKVYAYAGYIGRQEGLDPVTQEILEMAALVHDIGIRKGEAEAGRSDGRIQEALGPDEAAILLKKLEVPEDWCRRICYLVGHHHHYNAIDGPDYQILVEADFLVNLFEDQVPKAGCENALKKVFKTRTGQKLCREMYGLEENS
ncbi:MAG: HD domain-containing protein [Eubacteriaceae bacterium]|nr:HD domain-containing protein [Eubacteriaceae bacterium]